MSFHVWGAPVGDTLLAPPCCAANSKKQVSPRGRGSREESENCTEVSDGMGIASRLFRDAHLPGPRILEAC